MGIETIAALLMLAGENADSITRIIGNIKEAADGEDYEADSANLDAVAGEYRARIDKSRAAAGQPPIDWANWR